ncbi:hypothetical protein K432DRAFT_274308, partial [Lepidopterella palustris CBS 459.81]
EAIWRQAGSKKGLKLDRNFVFTAISSPQTVALWVFKSVLHWMFSLAMSCTFAIGVTMRPVQNLYLTAGVAILAIFATGLALWKPKGSQPVNYGHLHTIINTIDSWPKEGGKIY